MIGSTEKVDWPATENKLALFPFRRLYRAFIGADGYGTERAAFVEAASHRDAVRKIANAVAALETRLPDASEDIGLRLFETGYGGESAVSFVEQPLFLVAAPAALIRQWAQISEVSHGND